MKILIFGDTHLGKRNFKIKQREEDFENAFSQVINHALTSKVEAVIHSGDLFDSGIPSISTMIFCIKELGKLKNGNIPFFITAGSHDVGSGDSFLRVLDELGLIINVSSKKYYSRDDDAIIITGEKRNGVFVCGLPGRNNQINEVLEIARINIPKNCFRVFLFHHIISDINPLFSTLKKSCLPKSFDLYVSGHWHDFFEASYEGKKLLYPGSTERCDFREMHSDSKGFIVYDTDNNNFSFEKLSIRKSIIFEINCTNLMPDEIIEKVRKKIVKGNGEMLFFVLKGGLKGGVKSEINLYEIYELAAEMNYLFCKIYTGALENPEEKQTIVHKKSINEIEKEFFKNKGFNNKETLLAQEIINVLGSGKSSQNIEEKINNIISWLKGEMI